jgi:hypothetical protein
MNTLNIIINKTKTKKIERKFWNTIALAKGRWLKPFWQRRTKSKPHNKTFNNTPPPLKFFGKVSHVFCEVWFDLRGHSGSSGNNNINGTLNKKID